MKRETIKSVRRVLGEAGLVTEFGTLQAPAALGSGSYRIRLYRERDGSERIGLNVAFGCELVVQDVCPERTHAVVAFVQPHGSAESFLLGRDERQYFAAALPANAATITDAFEALKPEAVRQAEAEGKPVVRQGEWFFVPEPVFAPNPVSGTRQRRAPIQRSERTLREWVVAESWMNGNAHFLEDAVIHEQEAWIYARGRITHREHKTLRLNGWHRVYLNREVMGRGARTLRTQGRFWD